MALNAGVFALILDWKVFPVLDTAETVIAVGEIPAMNSEVIGNQEYSQNQDCSDYANRHPQRVQHVPLHLCFPRVLFECETPTPQSTEMQSRELSNTRSTDLPPAIMDTEQRRFTQYVETIAESVESVEPGE